jgi:hypothetical protein
MPRFKPSTTLLISQEYLRRQPSSRKRALKRRHKPQRPKKAKHTPMGILRWSPIWVLIRRVSDGENCERLWNLENLKFCFHFVYMYDLLGPVPTGVWAGTIRQL